MMTKTNLIPLNDESVVIPSGHNIAAQVEGESTEPEVGASSSEQQTTTSEVEQAAEQQVNLLKREANNTLAALKQQEQQKLNTALSELKSQSVANVTPAANSESPPPQTPTENIKTTASSLDQLLMEGQLLHPLAGLEKIQGIHKVQLDTLLTQINATLHSGENLTDEEGS